MTDATATIKDEQQAAPPAATPSALKALFRRVAGVALPGALLTTGFGIYGSSSFWNDAPLSSQFVDTASIFLSHMTVWTVAIGCSVAGWKIGQYFQDAETRLERLKPWAAGLGVALISATFVWPLGGKIYDKTHDGLSALFNIQEPAKPDYSNYQYQNQPSTPPQLPPVEAPKSVAPETAVPAQPEIAKTPAP